MLTKQNFNYSENPKIGPILEIENFTHPPFKNLVKVTQETLHFFQNQS